MDATLRKHCRLSIADYRLLFCVRRLVLSQLIPRLVTVATIESPIDNRQSAIGNQRWGFPRDLNSAIRFTGPTHRHLCLESNWSRWRESNSRVRVLQTRAFPLGYTRDIWCSHRELNSDPMFKRHLRFRYAIGAWFWRRDSNSHHALIRGLRLIRPLHYQLCYASRKWRSRQESNLHLSGYGLLA